MKLDLPTLPVAVYRQRHGPRLDRSTDGHGVPEQGAPACDGQAWKPPTDSLHSTDRCGGFSFPLIKLPVQIRSAGRPQVANEAPCRCPKSFGTRAAIHRVDPGHSTARGVALRRSCPMIDPSVSTARPVFATLAKLEPKRLRSEASKCKDFRYPALRILLASERTTLPSVATRDQWSHRALRRSELTIRQRIRQPTKRILLPVRRQSRRRTSRSAALVFSF
jgi:hypothetical protein